VDDYGGFQVKELVVISGKGGTGKTSIVASLAALEENVVTADCDVDAADLHLLLDPHVEREEPFSGGKIASIDADLCTGCGKCEELCRFGAISRNGTTRELSVGGSRADVPDGSINRLHPVYAVDKIACEGCGVCAYFCPMGAVDFSEEENGIWFVSRTRFGPMVHARLHAGSENSGKLVSLVRREARRIAERSGIDLVLIDGSPGIGCPVIASITGSNLVLIVTEPTESGFHDLERVMKLTKHFGIETMVVVNKYDINEELTRRIEAVARREGAALAGRIRYDNVVTKAQIEGKSVVELPRGPTVGEIERLHEYVRSRMKQEVK
jgi:MinD superfamily P-loop ATPase